MSSYWTIFINVLSNPNNNDKALNIYFKVSTSKVKQTVQMVNINDIINEKLPVLHRKVYAGTTKTFYTKACK